MDVDANDSGEPSASVWELLIDGSADVPQQMPKAVTASVLPEIRPPDMAEVEVMSVVTVVSIVTAFFHSSSSVLLQAVAIFATKSRQIS
jgi:hypothetical protein